MRHLIHMSSLLKSLRMSSHMVMMVREMTMMPVLVTVLVLMLMLVSMRMGVLVLMMQIWHLLRTKN